MANTKKIKEDTSNEIFHHQNNIFITSKNEIKPIELQKYLMEKFTSEILPFPEGTTFYFITGFHHLPSSVQDGKPGMTDFRLSEDFYENLVSNLEQFCGNLNCQNCKGTKFRQCASPSLWEKMKFKHKLIQLSTKKVRGQDEYELSEMAKNRLQELARKLMKRDGPFSLIFASCYSYFSEISKILRVNGIISLAQLVKEKGDVTEGRAFRLDDQQSKVISDLAKVR